jgi:TrwC relaxase
VTTIVSIKAGHDVVYYIGGSATSGCAGAMSYYTAAGEPPAQWTGRAAVRLDLNGAVDAGVIRRPYQDDIAPTGEILAGKRQPKAVREREDAAVEGYLTVHPMPVVLRCPSSGKYSDG